MAWSVITEQSPVSSLKEWRKWRLRSQISGDIYTCKGKVIEYKDLTITKLITKSTDFFL